MHDTKFKGALGNGRLALVAIVLALLLACMIGKTSAADSSDQQVFTSPNDAVTALVGAARNDDLKALQSILGSDAQEILSSGDEAADNKARDEFVAKYDQMHRLAFDLQDRVILYIGADNWPLPLPIVQQSDGWVFDTASGKQELLYRRIGRNELFTIDILQALFYAQNEYASESRDGGVKQFAQRIQSRTGKRDGLYWPVGKDEPQSPIGPLIASATAEGYQTGSTSPVPFHGYYYRILTQQGKNAPGGAKNYIVNGAMTGGFAFLAYPASYRASGVMTFMINRDGVLVEKDIGPDTVKLASAITEYNPDKTWDQEIDASASSSPWAELATYQ